MSCPQVKSILKVKKTKKDFCRHFFCSNFSTSKKIFDELKSNHTFLFDSEAKMMKYLDVLNRSGIDKNLAIYKFEYYKDKNIEQLKRVVKAFCVLNKQGINFNLFVFVDSDKRYIEATKVLNVISTCKSVKLFHCLDIDYKLLSAINYLNILSHNYLKFDNNPHLVSSDKMTDKTKKQLGKASNITSDSFFEGDSAMQNASCNFDINLSTYCAKSVDCSTLEKLKIDLENDFKYNKFYFSKEVFVNGNILEISKTFEMNQSAKLFSLGFKNKDTNSYCFDFDFDICAKNFECKYVLCEKHKNKFFIKILDSNFAKTFCVALSLRTNTCIDYFAKTLQLRAKTSSLSNRIFFGVFVDKKKFFEFDETKLENAFFDAKQNYNALKLPKVFSPNKTINYLVNVFLPNRIIKNFIEGLEGSQEEFLKLKSACVEVEDKTLVESFVQKFFLAKSDLYHIYFNLLFYYFGVFATKKGIKINPDKSLIFDNSYMSVFWDTRHFLKIKNRKNNSQEFLVNTVSFSNLNFVQYTKDSKMEICF